MFSLRTFTRFRKKRFLGNLFLNAKFIIVVRETIWNQKRRTPFQKQAFDFFVFLVFFTRCVIVLMNVSDVKYCIRSKQFGPLSIMNCLLYEFSASVGKIACYANLPRRCVCHDIWILTDWNNCKEKSKNCLSTANVSLRKSFFHFDLFRSVVINVHSTQRKLFRANTLATFELCRLKVIDPLCLQHSYVLSYYGCYTNTQLEENHSPVFD